MVDSVELEPFEIVESFGEFEEFPKQSMVKTMNNSLRINRFLLAIILDDSAKLFTSYLNVTDDR